MGDNAGTVERQRSVWLQYLSLFSSLGTLLCCALPSVLVLLGVIDHLSGLDVSS